MHTDTVAILMATFNGQKFLEEQIHSIESQSYQNWKIWISDDESKDDTFKKLLALEQRIGKSKISINKGPQKGFCQNFLSLICHADIKADFYAFADQDDIWQTNKLKRAVDWLKPIPKELPALYCSRTEIVSDIDKSIGQSPLFKKPPSFANALVQNIAGGNTMVMNDAARSLLKNAGEFVLAVSHDWWAYQLITGAGGVVFYDPVSEVRYRQHSNNLVGSNNGLHQKLQRIVLLFKGRFRSWNAVNIKSLNEVSFLLNEENLKILQVLSHARDGNLLVRLFGVYRSGVYRQTLCGNLGLFVATIFKKL
ncbi:glycosyl transferase family 2 [Methylotenera versatilis 301]|uniref:Glycosyl transferase family 2 n=1 Tax=Methylotenera versatilis (strain 301) TaxID=666681 RepID=D7DHU3_METV0|nr:glycosyl transferase family 2 [Methylotenera versatilis 301]